MGFNYRQERKKFEEQMQENERRFRAAGMSDEQIMAMREYEEEQFRRERVYKIHIVLEQSKEYPGLIEWVGTTDSYFQKMKASLDFILDNVSPGLSASLSSQEKEIMLLLSWGATQQEISAKLGLSQSTISYHIKHIEKTFKSFR